ncbi:MAG: polysaccharide biosynthesis/export family protein [Planctomycetota bacterium]
MNLCSIIDRRLGVLAVFCLLVMRAGVANGQERWPIAAYTPSASVVHTSSAMRASSAMPGCSHCQPGGCVDRDGTTMIGSLGMRNGIGTGTHPDCQCWKCPCAQPFSGMGPGSYAFPSRTAHVTRYRLRPGDTVQLTFLVSAVKTNGPYRLVVGDQVMVESEADEGLKRGTLEKGLEIQPDGTITLRYIGPVHAAGTTIEQLRDLLNEQYTDYYPDPAVDVTPVRTGTAARQVREAISGAGGFDPQSVVQTVSPSGEIRLPRLGSVSAQGLTIDELKEEINLRYDDMVGGLEVEPSLQSQAPHYFYVLGEAAQPGRYDMNAPTTVMSAIAQAGGHVPGANLRQVVVFRRGENWELMSTLLDLRGAILGRASCPADEIWVRDGDVIILPSTPIRLFDNFVRQVFTEGVYGIVPFGGLSFDLGDH